MTRQATLFFTLIVLGFAGSSGAQPPVQEPAHVAFHQKLQRFERELDIDLQRLEHNGCGDALQQAERARTRLELLELEIRRLPVADAEPLWNKLHQLEQRANDLYTAAERGTATRASSDREQPVRVRYRGGSPPNDDCANAVVIGPGTFIGDTSLATNDGQTTCGSSLFSPDVWFKLVFPETGTLYADTFGSDYDTVLSIHSACPGTAGNTLACDDDAFGLGAAVGVFAAAGAERWIRVSGFGGETGNFTLHVGVGGEISGTVTDAATGTLLPDLRVDLWTSEGFGAGSTLTDVAGAYSLGGLEPGTYFVTTRNSNDYLDELYQDLPCPGGGGFGGCDPTTGTPILVEIDTTTPDIDFALERGGMITGTVIDASITAGAPGAGVALWDAEGSFVRSVPTDGFGDYVFDGLSPGTYFASTNTSDFADELYDDIPCPDVAPNGCDPTTGTPIEVTTAATTSGIDFLLDRLGTITGTVTEALTGIPVTSARVEIWSASGNRIGTDFTNTSGVYSVSGLSAGTYFTVATDSFHSDELYDDLPCPRGAPSGCDPTTGRAIEVTINETTTDIDFVLDLLGSITGVVTDAATSDPIPSLRVEIRSASGFIGSDLTDAAGVFLVERLEAGTYFAVTNDFEYLNELFDDVPCSSGCNVTTGTPIAVELGAVTPDIDFDLVRKGAISGTVTDQDTADPISGARVEIWDASGFIVWSGGTDGDGNYLAVNLITGTYTAVTRLDRFSDYMDELYEELPCLWTGAGGCDPTAGSPIAVTGGSTTTGIDFTLILGGAISGTVVDASTGDPISSGDVRVFDATGNFVAEVGPDSSGNYRVGGLPAGTHYALAQMFSGSDYLSELYDDLPCPDNDCDPTSGTAIETVLGDTVEDIDFELDRKGMISGTVTDAETGLPLTSGSVDIYNADGSFADFSFLSSSGSYVSDGLEPGTYFVMTDLFTGDYINELYDDLSCAESCPVLTGTPVEVSINATTEDIDFALDRRGGVSGFVTSTATGAPLAQVRVRIWNAQGSSVRSDLTNDAGLYTVDGLLPGFYFATTESDIYNDELFDNLPCVDGCDPTDGTPFQVAFNATTRHIDFSLDRSGSISGTIIEAPSGQPISGLQVRLWSTTGLSVSSVFTDVAGRYSFIGLPSGVYFVTTDDFDHLDQLYDGLPCEPTCDPTSGTPISVVAPADTPGIDFALDRPGVISGIITEAATALPIQGIRVEIWDASSNFVGSTNTDSSGHYRRLGLAPGTYFVSTNNFQSYLDELYDDLPCLNGAPSGCDPDKGTPIPVAANATTEGIDFELISASSGISGVTTEAATGTPRGGVIIDLWDASGQHVTSVMTSPSGAYFVELPPSTYFVSTEHGLPDLIEEVYDSVLCPGAAFNGHCDPTEGTPIVVEDSTVVGIPGVTTGIDFTFEPSLLFEDGFESGDFSAWSTVVGGGP